MGVQLLDEFKPVNEIVRQWAEEVAEAQSDYTYRTEVDEVENVSRDGFIAFTEGGFDACLPVQLRDCANNGWTPSEVQGFVDSARKDCQEAWDVENPEHTYEWMHAKDTPTREKWRRKYYDFEDEWMESDDEPFYVKVRALYYLPTNRSNETGEPEVLFTVGINTDFGYGRDYISWLPYMGGKAQQTTWRWGRTVKVSEITPDLIKTLTGEAIDALAKE